MSFRSLLLFKRKHLATVLLWQSKEPLPVAYGQGLLSGFGLLPIGRLLTQQVAPGSGLRSAQQRAAAALRCHISTGMNLLNAVRMNGHAVPADALRGLQQIVRNLPCMPDKRASYSSSLHPQSPW